jgi:thymidine kinase
MVKIFFYESEFRDLVLWFMFVILVTKYLSYFCIKDKKVKRYNFKSPTYDTTTYPLSDRVGSLHVFVGPMYASKTSTMLQHVTRYADISNNKPLIINHTMDEKRSVGNGIIGKGLSSHSSQYNGLSSKVDNVYTNTLCMVDVSKTNVIGIDEIQLYPDLYDTVQYWLSLGKHIYCSGLDGSFRAENFGQVHKLLPISDTFTKLLAVCHLCQKEHSNTGNIILPTSFIPAPFTMKISGNMSQEVEAGGEDKYLPVCRYHFYQEE